VRDFRDDWWALRIKAGLGKFVKRRDRKRENVASGRAYGSMICAARRHGICGGTVSIKTLSCESEDGRLGTFLGGTISSVKLTSAEVAGKIEAGRMRSAPKRAKPSATLCATDVNREFEN